MPKGIYIRTEYHKRRLSMGQKGKHKSFRTKEHKKKLSDTMKRIGHIPPSARGLKRSDEFKKHISVLKKGKRPYIMTDKIRGNMSIAWVGKRTGKNNPNWKDGITPENKKVRNSIEFRLWREAVFSRDNWTCQKYGIRGGKLHAHHISNFATSPELRFAIDNGVTLSKIAHQQFHRKYGKKNNTKEQLDEFLKQRRKIKKALIVQ